MNLTTTQRESLKPFASEAYSFYVEIAAIKENIKDIVEAAAEKTGIDKKLVSKHFATKYKGNLEELRDEVDALEFLAEQQVFLAE